VRRRRPLLALTLGDPSGIGPEVALAARRDERVRRAARLVLVGPAALRPSGVPRLARASRAELAAIADAAWLATWGPRRFELGRVQRSCGRAALAALRAGAELARRGLVDALVTAPVSKAALHAAGARVEGQTELLGRWAGAPRCEMLAVAGRLRVLLLTRHVPLREALRRVDRRAVEAHLELLAAGLGELGIAAPRLALAGLNPHAGEGGLLGREELEILRPAAERARARGIDVRGPLSPDAVFLAAARGEFDGVLALYHDQAFIPAKLHRPGRGVTVLLGLPYLRVSPAHGTAFDIAGRGLARPDNMIEALLQAARWAARRALTDAPARNAARGARRAKRSRGRRGSR
jgi:4-hydroxythreonine-4-phosphate dehydrogenase